MSTAHSYAPIFMAGVLFYAFFFVWKRASSRWAVWFPALRKGLEWSLIGAAIFLAFYSLSLVTSEGVQLGYGALTFVLGLGVPAALIRPPAGSAKEDTQRGAEMGLSHAVSKKIKAAKIETYLEIGGIDIPLSSEPYHFLIAGATGTGKSVAIGSLLRKIRARGDTAIIVDSGGGFLEKFYQAETDFVFNPYDDRCVSWSPTAEMQGVWDASALARSMVPDGIGESKEWNSYAQTFVGSVLRKLWEQKRLTLKDFLYYIQAAPRTELAALLEGTPAISQLASEKTFGSIRTIAGNYVASYDYLPEDGTTFSVSEMIRQEHSGFLYLTYRDDQLDSLRNILACLLDVAARTILSLDPSPDRRVWLIIDEFASLGKIQSIEAVATKARKAGGCLVLGIQSVSQLKDRYGDNGAQTILSCLSTWLVLRCSDVDTAEYMSKYMGDAEVRRVQQGQSTSDTGESQTWNDQTTVKRLVLGSQIQAFPNLHGMLKLAGDYPLCEVDLKIYKGAQGSESSFYPRNFDARPPIVLAPTMALTESAAPVNSPIAVAQPAAIKISPLAELRKEISERPKASAPVPSTTTPASQGTTDTSLPASVSTPIALKKDAHAEIVREPQGPLESPRQSATVIETAKPLHIAPQSGVATRAFTGLSSQEVILLRLREAAALRKLNGAQTLSPISPSTVRTIESNAERGGSQKSEVRPSGIEETPPQPTSVKRVTDDANNRADSPEKSRPSSTPPTQSLRTDVAKKVAASPELKQLELKDSQPRNSISLPTAPRSNQKKHTKSKKKASAGGAGSAITKDDLKGLLRGPIRKP